MTALGQQDTLDIALAAIRAHISVVPILRDGTKAAAVKWSEYRDRLPTEAEARKWWDRPDPYGIATVAGAVSGALEIIDFDDHRLFRPWGQLIEADAPGLLARLNVTRTPRPGFQVRFRCPDLDPVPGNQKLAYAETGETTIETRGEGGYALCVGCPPECHPSGRAYVHHSGPPLVDLPNLSIAERDILIDAAKSFCRKPKKAEPPAKGYRIEERMTLRATAGASVEERAIAYLARMPAGIQGKYGSKPMYHAARAVVYGFDLGVETGYRILAQHYNPRCDPPFSERELRHKCEDADTKPFTKPRGWLLNSDRNGTHSTNGRQHEAQEQQDGPPDEIDEQQAGEAQEPNVHEAEDDPARLARLHRDEYSHPDGITLRFHREEFHAWRDGAYQTVPVADLNAGIAGTAKREFDRLNRLAIQKWNEQGQADDNGKPIPCPTARKVSNRLVGDTRLSLASYCLVPNHLNPPAWVDGDGPHPANDIIAFRNGLLPLSRWMTGNPALLPPTPRYFTPVALDFDFSPAAPIPEAWYAFLEQLWGNDTAAIQLLQEWFGLMLTMDTSHQKILLLIGPKRSGKGTIARVLRRLVGERNYCSPTLASLSQPFGLQPLLAKTVAVVSDARMSGRTDAAVVAERLLSLSGEDVPTVPRKFLPDVTAPMPVRFSILTNELPRLGDASGALAGRFLILRLTQSFYGKEDHGLTGRLIGELPGILQWSLEGLRRLRQRGRLVQPESGAEMVAELEELSSPVKAFLRDCCELAPGAETAIRTLYQSWRQWCEDSGIEHPGDERVFGRNLRAAIEGHGIRDASRRDNGLRYRVYVGLRLRDDAPRRADSPFRLKVSDWQPM